MILTMPIDPGWGYDVLELERIEAEYAERGQAVELHKRALAACRRLAANTLAPPELRARADGLVVTTRPFPGGPPGRGWRRSDGEWLYSVAWLCDGKDGDEEADAR